MATRWRRTTFHQNYTPNPVYEIRGLSVCRTILHENYRLNPVYEIKRLAGMRSDGLRRRQEFRATVLRTGAGKRYDSRAP